MVGRVREIANSPGPRADSRRDPVTRLVSRGGRTERFDRVLTAEFRGDRYSETSVPSPASSASR